MVLVASWLALQEVSRLSIPFVALFVVAMALAVLGLVSSALP